MGCFALFFLRKLHGCVHSFFLSCIAVAILLRIEIVHEGILDPNETLSRQKRGCLVVGEGGGEVVLPVGINVFCDCCYSTQLNDYISK